MMLQEIKDFYDENKSYCITCFIVMVACIAGLWFVYDYYRNEPVYNNTDATVEQLEKRIDAVESGLDRVQKRNDEAKKTVESAGRGISTSTGLTYQIIEDAGRAEKRLDSAIERSVRIEGIIREIENSNR